MALDFSDLAPKPTSSLDFSDLAPKTRPDANTPAGQKPIYPQGEQPSKLALAGMALTAPWGEQAKSIGSAAGFPKTGEAVGGAINKGMEAVTEKLPAAIGAIPYAGRVLGPVSGLAANAIPQSPAGAIGAYVGGKALEAAAPVVSNIPIVKSAAEKLGQAHADILAKAKSLGIPMSISDITQSPAWAKIESTIAKTPFGASRMAQFFEKQVESAKTALQTMAQKYGVSKDLYDMGEQLKNSIAQNSIEKNATAGELYDAVGKMVGPDKFVQTPALQKAATSIQKELKMLPASMQNKELVSVVDDLSKYQGSTWAGIQQLRSKMMQEIVDNDAGLRISGQGIKFQSNPVAGAYKRLIGPLQDDMTFFGTQSGGKVNDALDLAKSFYSGAKGRFDSQAIRTVVKRNPEDVMNFVLKPNNITEIAAVRKAAGESGFAPVRQAFYQKLLTAGKGGNFSPEAMDTVLNKYGDATLKEIFRPGELEKLKDFSGILKKIGTANKMAGNPSGTAQAAITFSNGAMMVHNPVTGTITAIMPNLMARLITNDTFRNLLITGLRTPAISPQGAAIIGKLTGAMAANRFTNNPGASQAAQ